MLTIVDFGMGNLDSILSKLRRERVEARISSDPEEVGNASRLLLPGVGHFAAAMRSLRESGLKEAMNDAVLRRGVRVLGICLGAQLMTEHGEEGGVGGLGWIPGRTAMLKPSLECFPPIRVPHVGWSPLNMRRSPDWWPDFPPCKRFYFSHSYCVQCADEGDVVATTVHGVEFAAAFQRGAMCGVQFHPEKSHRDGFGIVKRFAEGA